VTRFIRRVLVSSRYFLAVAVLGSFAASAAALVYGGLTTAVVLRQTFGGGDAAEKGIKLLMVELVTIIDLFLLGTVLYVVAVGLHELFVDPGLPMPGWLRIASPDDLTVRLLGGVVVLLAVTFLGSAMTWDGSAGILALGLAVGVVLGVVSLTIVLFARLHGPHGPPGPQAPPAPRAPSGPWARAATEGPPGPAEDA
jgi:uncharacterized membrane protein YqhA